MKTLKVAIASFAHVHAETYVRALLRMSDVDLLTADPHGAEAPDAGPRGRDFAGRLGAAYVDSYDELFAWGPDAVIVTSENVRHRELVERAAAAGAHILCEKPLATEVADGIEMVAACERSGSILMVAYPVRFAPSYQDARSLIRDGKLGEMVAISGTNNGQIPIHDRQWFTDPHAAGGGALVDHIVHCADLIDDLTDGELPESVYAVSNGILHAEHGTRVETSGLVTLRYPSGMIASIDCSWSQPASAPVWGGITLQVTGTEATVEIAPFDDHLGGYDDDGEVYVVVGTDPDNRLLSTFLAAVRRCGPAVPGQPPAYVPMPDGHSGIRTLRIMDAARTSAKEGRVQLL
ncbi:Gfo/Idh/MocA family protein [Microbacterium sp. A588]